MTTTALDPHAPNAQAAGGSGGRRAVQRPGSSAAAVLTMTWTSLLTFAREPVAFVMGILYPLAMLVLFHTVFPWEIDGGITYSEYMLPVMITMGVLMTCLQVLAITVASERETGELKRLAVLPVPPWAYVVAKCMYNTVLALLNVVLLMVVGRFALGIDLPSSSRSWGLMILSLVLTIGSCTALGMAVGRICPSSRAASGIMTPLVIIFQFVSGLFLPLAQLPTWMVDIFSVFPVRWSAELMRGAFLPASFASAEPTGAWETGKALAVIAAWLVGGVVAAIVIARRDTVDR